MLVRRRYRPIDGIYKGETIVVLGTGPSLNRVDFGLLEGMITVGVNFVSRIFTPTYLISMDSLVLGDEENDFFKSKSEKFWLNWREFNSYRQTEVPASQKEFQRLYSNRNRFNGYKPEEDEPLLSDSFGKGMFLGNSSIFCAINLAYVMGAQIIILLGVDLISNAHFYKACTEREKQNTNKPFHFRKEIIAYCGLNILNGNSSSAVRCFPFYNLKTGKIKGSK